MQHGVKIIMVDYLQLMTANSGKGGAGNREQEIAMISRSLKAIAKELNVPVIALSQLSRSVETRPGKRPMLIGTPTGCLWVFRAVVIRIKITTLAWILYITMLLANRWCA